MSIRFGPNKTSLTPTLVIEVPASCQENERSWYICVRGIDYTHFYDFWIGFLRLFRHGQCSIFCFSFYASSVIAEKLPAGC